MNLQSWSVKIPDASNRFRIVLDGEAFLDKETGLVWEMSPALDTSGGTALATSWHAAIVHAYSTEVGRRKGWRLPTIEELASLVDSTQNKPSLPIKHPFVNVKWDDGYWSSTTCPPDIIMTGNTREFGEDTALYVHFEFGQVYFNAPKTGRHYVWCVRGGHGYDYNPD